MIGARGTAGPGGGWDGGGWDDEGIMEDDGHTDEHDNDSTATIHYHGGGGDDDDTFALAAFGLCLGLALCVVGVVVRGLWRHQPHAELTLQCGRTRLALLHCFRVLVPVV